MPRPPVLGYLQSAVADNTAHSQMDKLLFEDEMSNIQSDDEKTPNVYYQLMGTGTEKDPEKWIAIFYNPDGSVESTRYVGTPLKKQQGGPISYLQPSVQDETAHDSMDRLMFENELEQQPQHSMRTYQQGYDPAMEWGEGMMPIGGALRLLKGTKDYSKMLKQLSKVADREKKTYEVFEDAARKHGPKIDAGGADKAGKDYLTTLWIQKYLQ